MKIITTKAAIRVLIMILIVAAGFFVYYFSKGQLDTYLDAARLRFWVSTKLPSIEKSPLHPRPGLASFPENLDDLFIVAHYDDESLACGGFLASEIKEGKNVGVVVVTFSQGDAPAARNWYGISRGYGWWRFKYIYGLKIRPKDRTAYAQAREAETQSALDFLGVKPENRIYLRYPDLSLGEIIDDLDKVYQGNFLDPVSKKVEKYIGAELKETLLEIISRSSPKLIVTHYPDDTASDHMALGRLVEDLVHKNNLDIDIWRFLVHWNNLDAAWAPEKYDSDEAWLLAEPKNKFVVPEGSPRENAATTEKIARKYQGNFTSWKDRLFENYFTQIRLKAKLKELYSKENEIFWDIEEKKLIEIDFVGENN